jgi:hypothetical protein
VALTAMGPGAVTAAAADRLFFEGDVVRGIPKSGPTGPGCVLNSQFKYKELVVWRVRVFDPAKKEQIGKGELKSLVVHLSDGIKLPMHFGKHPPKNSTDHFWTVSWLIPPNYPTGSFGYKVVATEKSGKQHSWQPFNVKSSSLTVIAAKK